MFATHFLTLVLLVVWLHFIGDFILQSDRMATSKSSSVKWLTIHIAVYALPLLLLGWQYAMINGALHWVTDFFSSKASRYFYQRKQNHWFFAVIGLDQAIHMTCLILTLNKWAVF